MSRQWKRMFSLALVLAVSLSLTVSCSSKPSDTLAKIKATKVLKIGMAVDPPFVLQQSNGQFYSFNPALCELLGKQLGVRVEFIPASWATIVAGLQANKYDVIGASISATAERKKAISFTTSYADGGNSWLVTKDSSYRDIASLNSPSVTIAYASGTFQEQATQSNMPKAKTRAIQNLSYANLVPELTANHADAISIPSYLAIPLASKFNLRAIPALADGSPDPKGVDSTPLAFGVRKGDDTLRDYLNSFLKTEIDNGTVKKLMTQYITAENAVS